MGLFTYIERMVKRCQQTTKKGMKMRRLFFYYSVITMFLLTGVFATTNPYEQELAADKASNPSSWRTYAKRYPIDPKMQPSLHALVKQLAKHMEIAGDVSVYVAEANTTNNFIPSAIDCTNTNNTYAIDLCGMFKSLTIGEDLLNGASNNVIKKFIAHELAHIKNNDFTKRLIVGLSCAGITYYLIFSDNRISLTSVLIRIGILIPIAIVLANCFKQQEENADTIAKKYLEQF